MPADDMRVIGGGVSAFNALDRHGMFFALQIHVGHSAVLAPTEQRSTHRRQDRKVESIGQIPLRIDENPILSPPMIACASPRAPLPPIYAAWSDHRRLNS